MAIIGIIKCFLGFHKWPAVKTASYDPNNLLAYQCMRCGKTKETY